MLFGTDGWEVNNSYARGFMALCAACGTAHRVKITPELTHFENSDEGLKCLATGALELYAIIECEECDQVVRINPDQTSEIIRESKHVTPTRTQEDDARQEG